ncbi:PilW family protein [Thiomonas sp.]
MKQSLSAPFTLVRQRGLSLIELMIALVIGLIFSLAVLLVQASLTRENVRMSDVTLRDNQARTALDLITRDLSNAGFMLGGVQSRCNIMLAYNSSLPAQQFFAQYPVSAASQPLALPTSTSPLPTNTPDPNAYGNATQQFTDMLFFTGTDTAIQVPSNGNPPTYVVQNSTAQASTGQGAINSSTLPLGSTAGIQPGDTALLRMPLNGKLVCFRVPIADVGPSTSPPSTYIDSKSTNLFPSTGYSAFEGQLQTAGILPAGGILTNANFVQARLTDLGASTATTRRTIVYYIGTYTDASGGSYPILVRAILNSQTDELISANPIAAGVVSLQALFGVDETNSGGVTNYLTWPDVLNGNYTGAVRSVLFALVTKTLHGDPKYNAPAKITIPSPAGAGNDKFTSYTVPASYAQDRFSLIESEVAVRNQLWPH